MYYPKLLIIPGKSYNPSTTAAECLRRRWPRALDNDVLQDRAGDVIWGPPTCIFFLLPRNNHFLDWGRVEHILMPHSYLFSKVNQELVCYDDKMHPQLL